MCCDSVIIDEEIFIPKFCCTPQSRVTNIIFFPKRIPHDILKDVVSGKNIRVTTKRNKVVEYYLKGNIIRKKYIK